MARFALDIPPGERQRVAIARAICKDPALVVLDEATSSLDSASESLVQLALANLRRGRTSFVIAHRLATVFDANRIVVINDGRVVQIGTHAQLLAQRHGLYHALCVRQFGDSARRRLLRSSGSPKPGGKQPAATEAHRLAVP